MNDEWFAVSPMLRNVITVLLFLTLLGVPLAMLFTIQFRGSSPFAQLIRDHTAALLGVPWAGGAAAIVVLLFRATAGEIKFKVLGFDFEGASGPIVLWVLCFLAEILAIRVLWRSRDKD